MIAQEKKRRTYSKWWAGWATTLHRLRFVPAVPWAIVGLALFLFNVDINITLNRLWGAGNVFLIATTIYGAVQLFLSLLIMFEVGPVLRWLKFIRICNLVTSFWYNAAWLYALAVFLDVLYDRAHYGANLESVFLALVLGYNLVVTGYVVPMNIVIAIKELTLEWIQFNNPFMDPRKDISLGIHNVIDMFMDVFELFNPFCWFTRGTACFVWE